jgi:DNA-binding transcriptional LysR family regulator
VRQLEELLRLPLLERVGKRAVATPAGEVLLRHAERVFAERRAAREAVERLRGVVAGRIRLGTGATASIHLLPPLLRRLCARYPELELIVVTGNAAAMTAAVAKNELDVAIVTLPARGRELAVSPFFTDPLVAITAADRPGPGPRRGPVGPAELARHPLILYERGGTIRSVIDQWFRRAGHTPRAALELGDGEAIKKMVAAGLGTSIAPAISIRAEVRGGRLRALPLTPALSRQLGVVRRRDKPSSPAMEVFLEAVEQRRVALARTRLQPVARESKVQP